jgi:hypothetical protein
MAEVIADTSHIDDALSAQNERIQVDKVLQEATDRYNELLKKSTTSQETLKAKTAVEQLREERNSKASKENENIRIWAEIEAKKIGLTALELRAELQKNFNEMKPEVSKLLTEYSSKVRKGIQDIQKTVGESGKSLENSPKTRLELIKKTISNGAYTITALLGVLGLIATIISDVGKKSGDITKNNANLGKFLPKGCYQYSMSTGSIRTLGVCGATRGCKAISDKDTCQKNVQCDWDDTTKCTDNYSGSCTLPCKTDTDCLSDKDCSASSCPGGNCVSNRCQTQTCDTNTGYCTVPSPGTENISDMINKGKINFCTTGLTTSVCEYATNICYPKKSDGSGGACDACDSTDTACTNPSGVLNFTASCLCQNGDKTDWITIPICSSVDSMIITLNYMSVLADTWKPPTTPLPLQIIFWLSIAGFILTFIWYILYLVKHAKK